MMKFYPIVAILFSVMAFAHSGQAVPGDIPQWDGKYTSREGAYSSKEMWTKIIPNRESWEFVWKKLGKEKPVAGFDASREMGVFIQAGEYPSYGYVAKVLAAYPKDGKYVVEYGVSAPHSMVPQALTYPWVVAIVPRSDLPVVFKKREIP
jgi:hypothetical protein